MQLSKRIDILKVQIKTKQKMLEQYKNPIKLQEEIDYDKEILGYLEELLEFKNNHIN